MNTVGVNIGASPTGKDANTEAFETRFPADALMLAASPDVWEGADSILAKAGVRRDRGSSTNVE